MEINNNIFKKDQDGLYYIDNSKLLTPFSFNELVNPSFRRKFYTIDGIDNFIIKETYKKTNYFNGMKIKNLLINLVDRQALFDDIDFPIGYYLKDNHVNGTIVPYYKDSLSLRKMIFLHKKEELPEYYFHSDNESENISLLCLDILELIHELFEEDIYYIDIHSGNFLLYNNEVKLIDFDPGFVKFSGKRSKRQEGLLRNYGLLINALLRRLGYNNSTFNVGDNFEEAKRRIKEIKIR